MVTDLVKEINLASSEQAQGISQVNQGLSQLDAVTQRNSAAAEESASASQELQNQAESLTSMLANFKLRSGVIQRSSGMHRPSLTASAPLRLSAPQTHPPVGHGSIHLKPSDVIDLDDPDFGKF